VVAGTNYIVKYGAFVEGEEIFILAHIFQPLPLSGETTYVVAARADGVNADTPIPDFVDPVIIIEPVLGELGDSCTGDFECRTDLVCLEEQCSDPFVAGGWSSVKESPEDSDS
jgi:hypothetical protein